MTPQRPQAVAIQTPGMVADSRPGNKRFDASLQNA
jgi:hypothetical protein